MKLKVGLIDVDEGSRGRMKRLIEDADYALQAEGGYDFKALKFARAASCDAVFVGLDGPARVGLQLIRLLTLVVPGAAIVAYSDRSDAESVRAAMVSGAHDYLLKPVNRTEAVMAVDAALARLERPGTVRRAA